jgi:hypothetical protein
MRRYLAVFLLALVALSLLAPSGVGAQTPGKRYFPETGYYVGGRFLEYWQQHGGLAVFGFPVTQQFAENGLIVQYFERQRFELHPENARPYDVLLGRLGAQLWGPLPVAPESGPRSGCIWFPETRQNVCNQEIGTGFASYWQLNGLEFDGQPAGKSYQESLALFGYPITGVVDYTGPEGQRVQAQWFERARFEWHPGNPNPYKVLLGRLGVTLAPPSPQEPPPDTTTPPPTVSQVNVYMVAVGDDGRNGMRIGCGDSIVPVTVQIPATPAPLRGALERLLSDKSQYFGNTGLLNALYASDLRIDRVAIVDGEATVALSGTPRLSGTCDTPRVVAQLEETVRQFGSVSSVRIFLNNRLIREALSQQ